MSAPTPIRRGDHARRAARRAHHRARQSDRRRVRQADGRKGHVPGGQSRHLLRHEGAGGRVRHDGESLAKNEIVLRGRAEVAGNLQAPRRSGRLRQRPVGRAAWDQSREFTIRSEVVSPIEIIRSATTIGAEILRMEGKVGTLQPAPLPTSRGRRRSSERSCAARDQGKHLSVIMKAGKFHKNRLN